MIVLIAAVLGVVVGLSRAKARGGNRLDMAQYAAVHGIIFALLGLFVTLAIHRAAL